MITSGKRSISSRAERKYKVNPMITHDDDLADVIAGNEGTRCHPVNQHDLSTKLGVYPTN